MDQHYFLYVTLEVPTVTEIFTRTVCYADVLSEDPATLNIKLFSQLQP